MRTKLSLHASCTLRIEPLNFEPLVNKIVEIAHDWGRRNYSTMFDPKTRERFVQMGNHYVYENNLNIVKFYNGDRGESSYYMEGLGLLFVDAKFLKQEKLQIFTPDGNNVPLAQLSEDNMFAIFPDKTVHQIKPVEKQTYEYHFTVDKPINFNNFSKVSVNIPATAQRKEYKEWVNNRIKEIELQNALAGIDLSFTHDQEVMQKFLEMLRECKSINEFKKLAEDPVILACYLFRYKKMKNDSSKSIYWINHAAEAIRNIMKSCENARSPMFYDYFVLGE